MNNQEFIDFCYQNILERSPGLEETEHYQNFLDSNSTAREAVVMELLTCAEFQAKKQCREFQPTGHFYSAVPSWEERLGFTPPVLGEDSLEGININDDFQFELLEKFKPYYDQCPFTEERTEERRYYFVNPAYSYTDALTLYSMIRHFQPKRIIEAGSGFSSCVMLDTNDGFFDGQINLTFIEPYPELLYSLISPEDEKHTIIPKKLQEVDLEIFKTLQENDILFIDSTHVSKLNSDVNRIIFKILPTLQPGVIIHFHDIFWPFEYPLGWIQEGRAWNEAYLLRAFLEFNDSFEIIFFADYLHRCKAQWFQENMPLYCKNTGGNIWLRRKA